jgi:hypothetical protein
MHRADVVCGAVAVFALATMSGCVTRDPSIDIDRNSDGSYRIEVLRCRGDDDAQACVREDVETAARKRCRGPYRWAEAPVIGRGHLGTAVLGECPAAKAVATVICENTK